MENKKKKVSYHTEEQRELIHFAIVLAMVVIVVLGVYFFSKMFVMDKSLFEVDYKTGVINENRAIVGTILNRSASEYYVFVYDEGSSQAVYYSALSSKYTTSDSGKLPIYHVDLSNKLNEAYVASSDEASNPKATKTDEFLFKGATLLRIKNGKVVKYLEKEEEIVKELAV